MIVYDAAGVKTALSPDGSGSVYDAEGRRVSASSVTSQLYSFDNPPTNPSSQNEEFSTGALGAAWTVTSVGTTNPAVAGTVNPTSSLTTPIYDLATWPSYFLFQSDNSSAQYVDLTKTISLDANATIFIKFVIPNIVTNAGSEGNIFFQLTNSGDANESLGIGFGNLAGAGLTPRLFVQNNGVFTNADLTILTEGVAISALFAVIWKVGNVYYGGFAGTNGNFVTGPVVTKTGVTTFDTAGFRFRTANETPSYISGIDFIRYYGSVTYALRNQAL